MIVQPKQRNQPHRECLYAWYPEAVDHTVATTFIEPRDIYLHTGIDRNLLEQKPSTNGLTSAFNNSNTSAELLQRYNQSIAPSDRAYHSTETIDEALNPPWALHYEIKRRPATPNPVTKSTEMSIHEEPPRRLKSAPLVRSLPSTTVLNIPEPRFIATVIPVVITNPTPPPPPPSRPQTRASSARARLNTTTPNENKPQRREIKSAHVSRRKSGETKLSDEEIQEIFKRVYGDKVEQPQQEQPIQIIYTQPQPSPVPPPPIYVYQKSASWCPDEVPSTPPVRKSIEVTAIPLNPHYLHRPGVIAVNNVEKRSVVRETSASKKPNKQYRRYYHNHGRRDEPLRAVTPMPHKSRLSLEIGGVKLKYDPKLTLDDKSPNLTKYFIDGRLYLIKEQRYNFLDNIDPSLLEKYNQNLTPPSRQKYYQTNPVEKYQTSSSATELHYHTSPTRLHRYVIDPNLLSENFNVNKMSLSKRPLTATVYT